MADFADADLRGARFERADLSGARSSATRHRGTRSACLRVVLNEEWEHHLYANRDLAVLAERLKN